MSMQRMKDEALKEAKSKACKITRSVLFFPGVIFVGTFCLQTGYLGLFLSGIPYLIFYIFCMQISKNSNTSRLIYARIMQKNILKSIEHPRFEKLNNAERSRLSANLSYYNNMINRFSRRKSNF